MAVGRNQTPSRGEIWLVDLEPTVGGEIQKTRPAVVVSTRQFNAGPLRLAVVCPTTTTLHGNPMHVEIEPKMSGLDEPSCILADQVRTLSLERFHRRLGEVRSRKIMGEVADRLRILMDL